MTKVVIVVIIILWQWRLTWNFWSPLAIFGRQWRLKSPNFQGWWQYDRMGKGRRRQKNSSHSWNHLPSGVTLHPECKDQPKRSCCLFLAVLRHNLDYLPPLKVKQLIERTWETNWISSPGSRFSIHGWDTAKPPNEELGYCKNWINKARPSCVEFIIFIVAKCNHKFCFLENWESRWEILRVSIFIPKVQDSVEGQSIDKKSKRKIHEKQFFRTFHCYRAIVQLSS